MKFQVPQFVEVEDKIFWKLTLKQFIYVAGGGGLCLIFYLTLPFVVSIFLIVIVAVFSAALAFYQFNNRPFIFLVESVSKYLVNPKLYIWRKQEKPVVITAKEKLPQETADTGFVPKLSDSRLKELTWSLDAKETVNPVTK